MNKDKTLMKFVVISLAISSFSLLLVMFGDYNGNALNKAIAVLTGVLFWGFLIIGYVILGIISGHRKTYERKNRADLGRKANRDANKRPGIICFFSNQKAIIADIVMIVSFIINLIFMFIPSVNQVVAVIFIAIFAFAVHMHCVLNGVNFRYIAHISKNDVSKESRV